MKEEVIQPSPRRFLRSRRVLAANAGVFALLAWAFFGEWQSNHDLRLQVEAKTVEGDQIQRDYDQTAQNMDLLAGSAAAERQARLKLNLQKPGEEVFVVRGLSDGERTETSHAAGAAPDVAPDAPMGNAAGWWHYFFK